MHANWHIIDERAHNRLGSAQIHRSSSKCSAKHDIRCAALAVEQQRPGPLHKRAQCHLKPTCDKLKCIGRLSSAQRGSVVFNVPGIDGRRLLRQLRVLHPTLPVVVFSGLCTEEIEQEMLTQGATACIQKAFSLDQLGLALQEVLPSPIQADS